MHACFKLNKTAYQVRVPQILPLSPQTLDGLVHGGPFGVSRSSLTSNVAPKNNFLDLEARPEGPRAGGSWGGIQRTPSTSAIGKLPQRKFWILELFGTSEITSERSDVFFISCTLLHNTEIAALNCRLKSAPRRAVRSFRSFDYVSAIQATTTADSVYGQIDSRWLTAAATKAYITIAIRLRYDCDE